MHAFGVLQSFKITYIPSLLVSVASDGNGLEIEEEVGGLGQRLVCDHLSAVGRINLSKRMMQYLFTNNVY